MRIAQGADCRTAAKNRDRPICLVLRFTLLRGLYQGNKPSFSQLKLLYRSDSATPSRVGSLALAGRGRRHRCFLLVANAMKLAGYDMETALRFLMRDGALYVSFKSRLTREQYTELDQVCKKAATKGELRTTVESLATLWGVKADVLDSM